MSSVLSSLFLSVMSTLLLSVPLFDHVASFVAILDVTFSIVIQMNQMFECCVVQHALNPQIN